MTSVHDRKIAVLILAAGGSTRFGSPKQVAEIDGEPLLRRVINSAFQPWVDDLYVAIGAHAEMIRKTCHIPDLPVHWIENPDWERGIGHTIRTAVKSIMHADHTYDGLLLILGDQPYITPEHLDLYYRKIRQAPDACIAAAYNGKAGVPAYVPVRLWGELLKLDGDSGAKSLLRSVKTVLISLDDGLRDIDNPGDLYV